LQEQKVKKGFSKKFQEQGGTNITKSSKAKRIIQRCQNFKVKRNMQGLVHIFEDQRINNWFDSKIAQKKPAETMVGFFLGMKTKTEAFPSKKLFTLLLQTYPYPF